MNNLFDNHGHLSDYAFFPNKWFCYICLNLYAEFFMSWMSDFQHLFIKSTNIFFFFLMKWNLGRWVPDNWVFRKICYLSEWGLSAWLISLFSNVPFKWSRAVQRIVHHLHTSWKTNLYLVLGKMGMLGAEHLYSRWYSLKIFKYFQWVTSEGLNTKIPYLKVKLQTLRNKLICLRILKA